VTPEEHIAAAEAHLERAALPSRAHDSLTADGRIAAALAALAHTAVAATKSLTAVSLFIPEQEEP
jgi:hypothetical protein